MNRISTAYQYATYQREIREAERRYFDAHLKVTTGKRINAPSDDPSGTNFVLSARGLKSAAEQFTSNLGVAKQYLSFSAASLDDGHTLLREAYTIAVRANQTTVDPETRNGLALQVEEMQRRLVDIANAQGSGGQFLFAGQQSSTKPFAVDSGNLIFSGDNDEIRVETSANETLAVNTPGEQMFRKAYEALRELATNLRSGATGSTESDIRNLQERMTDFRTEWSLAGAKLNRVEEMVRSHDRRLDELVRQISDVEDIDLSLAILNYQKAQTAYAAALQVGSQGFQMSLMDFIR